ncbi:hypothetical protein L4D09_03665, partial [Photobacterium makurazakiensis]|uniref:hypothetical protein n=1 Tax=Photobacterium makurazakiensis TaxID=2910234 RepID=UPI003D0A124B
MKLLINKINKKVKHLLSASRFYFLNHNELSFKKSSLDETEAPENLTIFEEKSHFISLFKSLNKFFFLEKTNGLTTLCTLKGNEIYFLKSLFELSYSNGYILKKKSGKTFNNLSIDIALMGTRQRSLIIVENSNNHSSFHIMIEFWKDFDDFILSPSPNPISRKVWKRTLDEHNILKPGRVSNLSEIVDNRLAYDCDFDVDYVLTWVNSDDLDWQKIYAEHKPGFTVDGNSLS